MKYINFSQLRSFHAVAKAESITLASKLLNISQPTITKQIQLLEEFYSINVINRHARGVTLTDLGKKLFEITSKIFELEEQAIQLFSSNLNIHKGTLVTGTSGTYYIIKLIKEFKNTKSNILLRPEKIKIQSINNSKTNLFNSFCGEILEKSYLGSFTRYEIKIKNMIISVLDQNFNSNSNYNFPKGEKVICSWESESIKVLED